MPTLLGKLYLAALAKTHREQVIQALLFHAPFFLCVCDPLLLEKLGKGFARLPRDKKVLPRLVADLLLQMYLVQNAGAIGLEAGILHCPGLEGRRRGDGEGGRLVLLCYTLHLPVKILKKRALPGEFRLSAGQRAFSLRFHMLTKAQQGLQGTRRRHDLAGKAQQKPFCIGKAAQVSRILSQEGLHGREYLQGAIQLRIIAFLVSADANEIFRTRVSRK